MFENSFNSIALPVPLLRQVFLLASFRVLFFDGSWEPKKSSPLGSRAPLGANKAGLGGQLGSQNGAEIEVFRGPRGMLS